MGQAATWKFGSPKKVALSLSEKDAPNRPLAVSSGPVLRLITLK